MICLISYLNKSALILAATMLLLSACVGKGPLPPQLQLAEVRIEEQGSRALLDALHWTCMTEHGVAPLTFEYLLQRAGVVSQIYQGPVAEFSWVPKRAGDYQLKVIVRDAAGNLAESPWSPVYSFTAPVNEGQLYAVWPVENLSANQAPTRKIRETLVAQLQSRGLQVLGEAQMERFMRDARIRYVGGLDQRTAQQLADELGVAGVLLTSLETWQDRGIPRVSLITRLVVTGPTLEIAWIDSVGLTGDDHTGLLGIGRVNEPWPLAEAAVSQLTDSLLAALAGNVPGYRHSAEDGKLQLIVNDRRTLPSVNFAVKKSHRPRSFFRDRQFDPAREYRVAVVPFLNINTRKGSGKIVALHLLQQLQRYENIRVYEPGIIRDTLLRYRMIMQAGPSLAAADLLASERILGADLIMSGKVFDYQDAIGETKVDFSTQIFSGARREIIWTSRSYAGGNDGVYFFDIGKISSAHNLLRPMAQAVIRILED